MVEGPLLKIVNSISFIFILLTVEIATWFTEIATRAVLYLHVARKATKWTGYFKLAGHTSIKGRLASDAADFQSIASFF